MSMRRFLLTRPSPGKPGGAAVTLGEGVLFDSGPAVVLVDGAPVPVSYADVSHVGMSHPDAQVVYIDPEG